MSGSVSIDIDALQGAISALTGLAGRIETQRNQVVSGTPCSLPSLSAGTIGAVSSWLTDQEPELSTRLDLARLLATEGANVVTYTTDADTLANVQEMLGHEMAERVNDISYDTDDEDLDELNEILERRVTDPDVMSAMYEDLEPEGTARALTVLEMQQSMYGDGSALDLAKTMRQGLATASDDPSFSGESYANELMQLFIAPMHTDEQREWASENELSSNAGASLMAFLMKDVNYSPEFLTGAAEQARRVRAAVRRQRLAGRQLVVLPHRHQPVQRERERGERRPDGRDDAGDEPPARRSATSSSPPGIAPTSTSTSATGASTGTTASPPSPTGSAPTPTSTGLTLRERPPSPRSSSTGRPTLPASTPRMPRRPLTASATS